MNRMKGFNLIVTNFPPEWNRDDIKNFIRDKIPEIRDENMNIS